MEWAMSLVFAAITLSGPAVLVAGWLEWLRVPSRFDPPVWRSASAFAGLAAASVAFLATGVAVVYVGLNGGPMRVGVTSGWHTAAFWAGALPLFLAAVGKGPHRWHVAYSSVVLLCLWISLQISM
jgi:hypothetical protein